MSGPADQAHFAALFDKPSPEGLRALADAEFQRFVAFVFGRAGYDTKSRTLGFVSEIDLDVFAPGDRQKQAGVVAIRTDSLDRPISDNTVRRVQRSTAVRKNGSSAY